MQSKQKSKHVTNRQGVNLARLARDQKVSRKKFNDFLNNKKKVAEFLNQFRLRNLKNLESQKIISIPKMKFKRDDFLFSGFNGITKLWLSPNIENIFKPLVSKEIDFQGTQLEKLKIKKDLNVFDIQKELGNEIQKPDDIMAEIKFLTSQQPKGQKEGDLETPWISNIFYFEYQGRVWYLFLLWNAGHELWNLYCYETNAGEWYAGNMVFTPATDES